MVSPWQEWAIHEQFGEEFRNLVTGIEEEFGPAPAEVTNKKEEDNKDCGPANGRKRVAAGAVVEQRQKKNKVGSDQLVSLDKLGDAGLLLEVPLPHVKADGVCIRVMSGNRCFVVNKGESAVKLQPGTILAGFGAGNYQQRQPDELYDKENTVQEGTPGNTKLQTLGTLLPISSWGGVTNVAGVVFGVRWAPSGLMPTRPQVLLTAELNLPPGTGCSLTK